MSEISPDKLVLRCFGHKTEKGNWFGKCIELNIAAEAESVEELESKLYDMITSFFRTVYETDDHKSIPALLKRRAPISDYLKYHFIKFLVSIMRFSKKYTQFNESIPCSVGFAAH